MTCHEKCNIGKMAVILGAVLCLGVLAFTVPYLITYCNQTSENVEEIPEEKKEDEIVDKELATKEKSQVKKISKVKEKTIEKNDEAEVITRKVNEENVIRKELCNLRNFSEIEEESKETDDETIKRTEKSNIFNDTSDTNGIQQLITVQAEVHNEESLESTNNQTPVNHAKKKQKFGKKIKKLFTRSKRKRLPPPIEESGSSSGFTNLQNHSSPSNQHPLANSTILNSQLGTMNFQFHSPNGSLALYSQPPNRRISSLQDSGFRSSIGTVYKDLPNGGHNFVTFPLPDSGTRNVTILSIDFNNVSENNEL